MSLTQTRTIPFARPWITEEDKKAVLEVLEGPILTHGPQCKNFEAEFAAFLGEGAHAVSVSSCMAALHLAYLQLKIGPGDEVIVPAQTHSATAHAVEWAGAKPVFVDCDHATGNITPQAIEAALTPRTKAVSVVHFLGVPCDMRAVMALAQSRGLKVVEDCAIALGTRLDGTHVGLFGDAGCFSFYPAKHITTGEGGMFVSRSRDVAEGAAKLRAFGVDRSHGERAVPGFYDVPSLGLNYRMSELQAALGRSQLRRIGANLDMRRRHFGALKKALDGLKGSRVLDGLDRRAENSPYCLSLVLGGALAQRRNELVGRINQAGIGTSIYYPQPVPRMTYYRNKYGWEPGRYPHAAAISDGSFTLPVGPHLSEEDVDYIASNVKEILK